MKTYEIKHEPLINGDDIIDKYNIYYYDDDDILVLKEFISYDGVELINPIKEGYNQI
jgi:hypothetical protein